jgi:hypothetical protein
MLVVFVLELPRKLAEDRLISGINRELDRQSGGFVHSLYGLSLFLLLHPWVIVALTAVLIMLYALVREHYLEEVAKHGNAEPAEPEPSFSQSLKSAGIACILLLAVLGLVGGIYAVEMAPVAYPQTASNLLTRAPDASVAPIQPSNADAKPQIHSSLSTRAPKTQGTLTLGSNATSPSPKQSPTVGSVAGPITQSSSGPCSPNIVGGNADIRCSTPSDPNKMTKYYDCYGRYNMHGIIDGTVTFQGGPDPSEESLAYDRMAAQASAGVSNNATLILNECMAQIKSSPDWLTPNLFCALAYGAKRDRERERFYLNEFESRKGDGYKDCSTIESWVQRDLGQP